MSVSTSSTCGLIDPVHVLVELWAMAISVAVVGRHEQVGVDHLVLRTYIRLHQDL